MWFLEGGTLLYRAIAFFYHSKTGQQLFQRSKLTELDLFSASQCTKHWPRFPVNIERSLTPWRQSASHVKVRGNLSKMDVIRLKSGS